jgi:hypothetical protein
VSTTPPQPPPPPPQSAPPPTQGYDRPHYGAGLQAFPTPNGELVVFLVVSAVVGIVALASDLVDAGDFVTLSVFLAAAYMISRGIAKASRVYEGR